MDQSFEDDSDEDDSDKSMPELEQMVPQTAGIALSLDENGPLSSVRSRYVELEGPPLKDNYFVSLTNIIWENKGNAKPMKELHEKYPKPNNVAIRELTSMKKFYA